MTARKPEKPKRKATDPAIKELRRAVRGLIGITDCQRERIETIEKGREFDQDWLEELHKRLKSMEARAHFRDASHDEPVSNAAEAVGQHASLPRPSIWRRFWNFMGSAS